MKDNDRTKEELRARLPEYVQSITTTSRGNAYVCPLCGSGTGPNGTGAFNIDPKTDNTTWKCFSCQESGDLFSLIGLVENIPDFMGQYSRACEIFDIEPLGAPRSDSKPQDRQRINMNVKTSQKAGKEPIIVAEKDIRKAYEYLAGCQLNVSAAHQYLVTDRRLTTETVERFKLGYDSCRYDPNAKAHTQVVTIPYGDDIPFYVTRAMDYKQYLKPSGRTEKLGAEIYLFNEPDLYKDEPVFIVEGPFDAMSIVQEGGCAVAVVTKGAPTNLKYALDRAIKKGIRPLFIISQDNDEEGAKGADAIRDYLESFNLVYIQAKWTVTGKDANEMLATDPEQFRADIKANITRAHEHAKEVREQVVAEIENTNALHALDDFTKWISENTTNELWTSTGYENLDRKLDGGLYPGLYIIGAISSAGKTTFTMQMADYMAVHGKDVMIFSFEMSTRELLAKSLSRLSYTIDPENASTSREVMVPKLYAGRPDASRIIALAMDEYRMFGKRVYIKEGVSNTRTIEDEIERHISITGRIPVVIIDYLQIIQADADQRGLTDKQLIDCLVLKLKEISNKHKISVFAISSLNRDNYTQPINMASFKESGAIEYGSDVLLGLQYEGMDFLGNESDKVRASRLQELRRANEAKMSNGEPIRMELKILKNRQGRKGSVYFDYIPKYNLFNPISDDLVYNGEWSEPEKKTRKIL